MSLGDQWAGFMGTAMNAEKSEQFLDTLVSDQMLGKEFSPRSDAGGIPSMSPVTIKVGEVSLLPIDLGDERFLQTSSPR